MEGEENALGEISTHVQNPFKLFLNMTNMG
jgi:hypothetical protein